MRAVPRFSVRLPTSSTSSPSGITSSMPEGPLAAAEPPACCRACIAPAQGQKNMSVSIGAEARAGPPPRLVLPGLLGLGGAGLHPLGDALHLLLAERPLHRRQQLRLLVAGVLAEGPLQLLQPLREGLVALRQGLELGELGAQLAVILDRVGHQALGLGVAPEDREEVLLLEAGVLLQL